MTVTPQPHSAAPQPHSAAPKPHDTASEPHSGEPGAGRGTGPARRRKLRSSTVVLGSMGALAVALSGYSSEPDKRCVDPDSYDAVRGYRVLPPSQCEAPGTGPQAGSAAFPAAATTRAAATAPARHDRGLHDRGLHDRGRQEGGRQDGGRRADGPGTAWYYGGHEERGRAEGGTFIHAAAVERAGFGCDDDDDSSGGGGFGG